MWGVLPAEPRVGAPADRLVWAGTSAPAGGLYAGAGWGGGRGPDAAQWRPPLHPPRAATGGHGRWAHRRAGAAAQGCDAGRRWTRVPPPPPHGRPVAPPRRWWREALEEGGPRAEPCARARACRGIRTHQSPQAACGGGEVWDCLQPHRWQSHHGRQKTPFPTPQTRPHNVQRGAGFAGRGGGPSAAGPRAAWRRDWTQRTRSGIDDGESTRAWAERNGRDSSGQRAPGDEGNKHTAAPPTRTTNGKHQSGREPTGRGEKKKKKKVPT